jgi:superfamily I DNA/RNA helicase
VAEFNTLESLEKIGNHLKEEGVKMGKVERWIGGAGTGKTSLILAKLTEAKQELGLSPLEIGLSTFTRNGRNEIAERAAERWGCTGEMLTVDGWFRTAHSLAYKQCQVGKGQLLEGKEGAEWVGEALGVQMASKWDARSRETVFACCGDDLSPQLSLRAWDLARAKLVPLEKVLESWARAGEVSPPLSVATSYVEKYERRKRLDGRLDFTDLVARFAGVRVSLSGNIEHVQPEGEVPSAIRVFAVDEAQDSSRLVDLVCRRVAEAPRVERVLLCGDPYQSIYSFGGGDYRHFMSWEADEYTMPESHRCAGEIMAIGEACLRRMFQGYRDRGIKPAKHSGKFSRVGSHETALQSLSPSESCLILGRCVFALERYEAWLKTKKIPYSWIDKVHSKTHLSGYGALRNLEVGEPVHGDDWTNAIAMIPQAHTAIGTLLVKGEKAAWAKGKRTHIDVILPTDDGMKEAGMTDALIAEIRAGRWPERLDGRLSEQATRWRDVVVKYGEGVANDPPVKLSTIHSAKGSEADRVIVSTRISSAVHRGQTSDRDRHDEECRVCYVAATRARHELFVVEDSDGGMRLGL